MSNSRKWTLRLRRFAGLVFLFVSSVALAGDLTVTWVNATQDTTGGALPTDGSAQSLKLTQIQFGLCDALGAFPATAAGTVSVLMPAVTTKILALADGKWCVRARHQNNELPTGIFSAYSATASKVLTTVIIKPKPPSAVAIP